MLAERNHHGSALAAATATFPLNDVDFASSGTWSLPSANFAYPDDQRLRVCRRRALRRDDKDGGDRRDRTDDLMLAKQPLSQLSYVPKRWVLKHKEKRAKGSQGRPAAGAHAPRSLRARMCPPASEASPTMVGLGRLERPTSPLSGVRSNHLSYRPEPVPPATPSRRRTDPACPDNEKEKRGRRRPAKRDLTGPMYPMTPREERMIITIIITEGASLERR